MIDTIFLGCLLLFALAKSYQFIFPFDKKNLKKIIGSIGLLSIPSMLISSYFNFFPNWNLVNAHLTLASTVLLSLVLFQSKDHVKQKQNVGKKILFISFLLGMYLNDFYFLFLLTLPGIYFAYSHLREKVSHDFKFNQIKFFILSFCLSLLIYYLSQLYKMNDYKFVLFTSMFFTYHFYHGVITKLASDEQ